MKRSSSHPVEPAPRGVRARAAALFERAALTPAGPIAVVTLVLIEVALAVMDAVRSDVVDAVVAVIAAAMWGGVLGAMLAIRAHARARGL